MLDTKTSFLIVEDNLSFAITIEKQLKKWDYEILGIATSSEHALFLCKKQVPDFVLMDININGKLNGIALAQEMQVFNSNIIFITGKNNSETYKEALKAGGIGYLVKPFEMLSLKSFIDLSINNKTKKGSQNQNPDVIYFRRGKKLMQLHIPSIEWIKSDRNYCDVFANGRRNPFRMSLVKLLAELPKEQFMQVHRSYIINLNLIDSIVLSDNFIFVGEEKIPIGRKFRKELLEKITKG